MIITKQYLLYFLIYKNLQLKYKHSTLGFVWSVLHPLFYLAIFIAVFSKAFPSLPNYPLFVLSGLIFWIYFSGSTNQLCQVFIRHTHLIKSQNVPVYMYPIAEQISELFSFSIGLVVFIVLMAFFGMHITPVLLCIIPVILLFSFFSYSVGIILGSLNVFFRDVNILWNTLNPALFYLSPIAYSYDILPGKYHFIATINPLSYFFAIIRDILYTGNLPGLRNTFIACLITGFTSLIAGFIFRKTKNGFVSSL